MIDESSEHKRINEKCFQFEPFMQFDFPYHTYNSLNFAFWLYIRVYWRSYKLGEQIKLCANHALW